MNLNLKIKNKNNENLDTLIEGNDKSNASIVFVHGFATDKHETAHFFDDLASELKNKFRIVRFDLSGCGKSEGRTEDVNYEKHSQDLESIISYVKSYYVGDIYILAQSMGTFITALLKPRGIKKTIFTGIPNSNTKFLGERLIKRFGKRPGGKINYKGISLFPRSTGKVQKIGSSFWKVLFRLNPAKIVREYSKNTKLLIIHPKQDEIVGDKYLSEYTINSNAEIKWLNGDHSFKKEEDRKVLTNLVTKFFS